MPITRFTGDVKWHFICPVSALIRTLGAGKLHADGQANEAPG